jgi:hypothetical protein
VTDLANHTAATTAGYARVQFDRGAGKSPRYTSRYEKPIVGEPGSAGGLFVHEAHSDVSQADADTKALTPLNGARALRYGSGATANAGPRSGTTLTADQH